MRFIRLCALAALFTTARSLQARPPDGWDWNHRAVEEPNTWSGSLEWHHGQEQIVMPILLPQQPGAGWIIELPCNAADVEIGHVPELKPYGGWTPPVALHGKLNSIGRAAMATQIYPLVWWILHPSLGWSAEIPQPAPPRETTFNGVRCTLMHLSTPSDLRTQIDKFGIDVPPDEFNTLSPYADASHCFLIFTNVSPNAPETLPHNASADPQTPWTISFPSGEPLLPARALGGGPGWPDNIFIPGFWQIAAPAAAGITARHFHGGAALGPHSGPTVKSDAPYTRLAGHPDGQVILTPARGTWLHAASLADALFSQPLILYGAALAWTALCSYLSGGLAGLLLVRRWKPCARIALWNLGTIIALRIRLTRAPHTPELSTKTQQALFALLFSLIFVGNNLFLARILDAAFGAYAP